HGRVLFVVELFDRDLVHSGRSPVGGDFGKGRQQVLLGIDLVDQTEPAVSFDPRFEGRQHAPCPDRAFRPTPAEQDVSVLHSRFRHWRRLLFTGFGHGASIVLRPFAPPALPGFGATTNALTPERRLFLPVGSQTGSPAHEHRSVRSGLSVSRIWSSEHPVPNHPSVPAVAFAHNPSAQQASLSCSVETRSKLKKGSGFRLRFAGSPKRTGRNGFALLRAAHSPPVALHPASRRRSYNRLQAGVCLPEEDLHLSGQTRLQTHESRPVGALRL